MATIVDETKIKIEAGLRNNDEYENIRNQIKEIKAPDPNRKSTTGKKLSLADP